MCSLWMAEHSTLWCIAIFYRDEVLDYQKANEEEDPKSKDSLEIRKRYVYLFSVKRLLNFFVAALWNNCLNLFALMILYVST